MKIDFKDMYAYLQPYCSAIYLGGSSILGFIDNPHDYDIVFFANDTDYNQYMILRTLLVMRLKKYLTEHNIVNATNDSTIMHVGVDNDCFDFFQIKSASQEEHAYGSYINKLMIKLAGNDIKFTFDVIEADRQEYIQVLNKAVKLLTMEIHPMNPKRWYQVYTGLCIVLNKAYEWTDEQKKNINILHDMDESTLEYRMQLQQKIKETLESLTV